MKQQYRDQYNDHLQRTVRANLLTLYRREKDARTHIAEECFVTPSTVTKWTAEDGSLPAASYLKIIARHFNVTVDWILTDHTVEDIFDRRTTYVEAMIMLKPLIDNKSLDINNIQDPILQYLSSECQRIINNPDMDNQKKALWMSRVMELFNHPLPKEVEPVFWKKLKSIYPKIMDPDPLVEYSHLAAIVGDESIMLILREKYQT